nr:MAG TPA: hypothetical protein [Bacteriophage sp.]
MSTLHQAPIDFEAKRYQETIDTLRFVANLNGYKLGDPIVLIDKKTGEARNEKHPAN